MKAIGSHCIPHEHGSVDHYLRSGRQRENYRRGSSARDDAPSATAPITATTREPRSGEVDGRDYHFWTKERFETERDAGQLLEHAFVHGGDFYGTPQSEVDPFRRRGEGVILVIDVQGAAQVRQLHPEAFSIFMRVPGDRYEERLHIRGDNESAIERTNEVGSIGTPARR